MRGEFAGVKSEIIKEIFEPIMSFISDQEYEADDLWIDLLREAIPAPETPSMPTYLAFNDEGAIYLPGDLELYAEHKRALDEHKYRIEAYTDAASHGDAAWIYIAAFFQDETTTERQLVKAVEDAFEPLQDHGGDALSNEYFGLVGRFVEKFSLRYDLRRPHNNRSFALHPTLPGLFSRLVRDLKTNTQGDPALTNLMRDFEDALRDLKDDNSQRRIKQCIAAQFNLFEALLTHHPDVLEHNTKVAEHNVTASAAKQRKPINTFGSMCDKANVWPHSEVLTSAKSLYKFASDYPGLRHAGTPANQKRDLDMRDMISLAIILAGFSPYFSATLDPNLIYLD
jgi:hypothetical protein